MQSVSKTKAIGLVVSLVVLLSSYGYGSTPFRDEDPGGASEKKVVELINRARAKGMRCGGRYYKPVQAVAWSEILWQASSRHCSTMARKGILCHSDNDGGRPGESLSRLGYKWSAYGENVGEGYRTPEEMVDGWLKSPGHCENIMNPAFREAGSSYFRGARKIYWTLILAAPGRRSSEYR